MYELYKELKQFGKVKTNTSLASYTSFKVGGPADLLVEVNDRNKLIALLNRVSSEGLDIFILGGGSNILFPDDGLRGVVVKMNNKQLTINNTTIEADAGVMLSKVVEASVKHGLTGFEWAAGIPGTVGGAVRGNAGARYAFTGGEMVDSVQSVTVWRNGEVLTLTNAECEFGYRNSIFKHTHDVVLGCTIKLIEGDVLSSVAMVQKIIAERKGKHAHEPSAGSFFKNVMLSEWKRDPNELPERFRTYKKIAAGWLIEQAGLKGFRVGNAMISPEHANFIINKGGATQADILAIVEEVTERVYTIFSIELEPEVHIVR